MYVFANSVDPDQMLQNMGLISVSTVCHFICTVKTHLTLSTLGKIFCRWHNYWNISFFFIFPEISCKLSNLHENLISCFLKKKKKNNNKKKKQKKHQQFVICWISPENDKGYGSELLTQVLEKDGVWRCPNNLGINTEDKSLVYG